MSDDRLRSIEDKLISHDKDIHSIANSVDKIAKSVEKMAISVTDQAVRDERMMGQIDAVGKTAERAHNRIDEHDKVFKRVMWLVVTPVVIALIGLVVVKGTSENTTNKQLKELTQAVQSIKK